MRGRRSAAHQLVAPRLAMACSAAAIGLLGALTPAQAQLGCPQKVTISPTVPKDECDGAFKNSPQNAAIFAWEAFVALNWPALPGTRETPDSTKTFGANVSPVVWETMRAKVEVYPGNGKQTIGPHGATINQQPPFGATNPPLFGYDDPPDYVYSPAGVGTPDGRIAACTGQIPPQQPAWIPLDETTQIRLNQTFAGILPATDPTGNNSAPRLIRYMVKMNRALYTYIVGNQFWYKGPPLNTAMTHFQAALARGQTQDPDPPFVEFSPPLANSALQNTIEVKGAWRPLTATEATSARFHTATVRYYEASGNRPCYREATWGLVGLHVIQKTPSAPWFIWATFEQADNVLDQNGNAVEDVDGNAIGAQPWPEPTTPALTSNPASATPTVTFVNPNDSYCAVPGSRLFFRENPTESGLPSDGNICVNRRWHPISPAIIKVNALAHGAIKSYLGEHGQSESRWLYYKLVNVQPVPFDKSEIMSQGADDASTYYTANAVIETDYTLGNYSGRIASTGAPSDVNPDGSPFKNTRFLPFQGQADFKTPLNMGGCTGCHANTALKGTEFSFSLADTTVRAPELPNPFQGAPSLLRDRALFAPVE